MICYQQATRNELKRSGNFRQKFDSDTSRLACQRQKLLAFREEILRKIDGAVQKLEMRAKESVEARGAMKLQLDELAKLAATPLNGKTA